MKKKLFHSYIFILGVKEYQDDKGLMLTAHETNFSFKPLARFKDNPNFLVINLDTTFYN